MKYNRGSYKPPKPQQIWKKGHKCTICGLEMLEHQLSKTDYEQEYEKRWGLHYPCKVKLDSMMDRNSK